MITKLLTIVAVLLSLISNRITAQESGDLRGANRLRPSDIFQFTNIWTIHLSFTPEQWEGMEPKQSDRPQFGDHGAAVSYKALREAATASPPHSALSSIMSGLIWNSERTSSRRWECVTKETAHS